MDDGIPAVHSLVLQGIQKVPSRFIKPVEERPESVAAAVSAASAGAAPEAAAAEEDDVPVLTMEELQTDEGLRRLVSACKEWGFFQLSSHGIPLSLLHKTRDVVRSFFTLSEDDKRPYSLQKGVASTTEGYGRYFVPSKDTVIDWVDGFYHQVPPRLIPWPTKPAEYKETMEEYCKKVGDLVDQLLVAMAVALEQPRELFVDMFSGPGSLRMNYYPPCPEPGLVMGLSPHSDATTCLTVLLQDEDVRGLQVRKDGEWRWIKPMPGALVVNVGDLMEIASNGAFRSVEHRAVVNSGKARLSVAAFRTPGIDTVIKPLVTGPGSPPLFREVKMAEIQNVFLSGELKGKGHLEWLKLQ